MSITAGASETVTESGTTLRDDAFEQPQQAAQQPTELDDVAKDVVHRHWHFEGDLLVNRRGGTVTERFVFDFEQKPLSYLAMCQFTGLLGRKLDEAMGEGLTIEAISELASVASVIQGGSPLSGVDLSGVDAFIRSFAKLTSYVPDLIADAQCIWLRVPLKDRQAVIELWSKPVDEGGLSSDEGEEMLILFIRQNYEELERFFVERAKRIARTALEERRKLHPQAAD